MAKLTFNPVSPRNKRTYKILVKDFKIRPGETIDIPAKYAISYYGDRNWDIVWDKKDKEDLLEVHESRLKRVQRDIGGQGSKDIVERLIPEPKKKAFTKKIIMEAVKPIVKKPAPKKVKKKEPKKEELKPPIEKKKPAKKAAPKAKKPIKDSEL